MIIIPTYNEALMIEKTINAVFQAILALCNHEVNILIFDSASQDDTQKIVCELQRQYPRLYLQTEAQKSGLGKAYHAAMHYAMTELKADIIVEFDGDLSHQPKYLVPMLESIEDHDVVVGSRYVKGGSIPKNWSLQRKLLSRLGNVISGLVLTKKYKDYTSGFRATRTSMLQRALPNRFISLGFAYKIELLWRLYLSDANIIELPIEFIDRCKGKSKLPRNSIIDSLRVLLHIRFGK